MPSLPLVSIVIPVFNGGNFLREAIESALGQTYRNCEVIVVNDGSNDNGQTRRICLSFGDRIRYFETLNRGISQTLNLGIREMNGAYFAWLSHDDLHLPEKTERQVAFLNEIGDENCVLYCDCNVIDARGERIAEAVLKERALLRNYPPLALFRGRLHGCGLLIPRRAFEAVGLFDKTLLYAQDYDMWLRMIVKLRFVHQPEILFSAREHSLQRTKMLDLSSETASFWLRAVKVSERTVADRYWENRFQFYREIGDILVRHPDRATAAQYAWNRARKLLADDETLMPERAKLVAEMRAHFEETRLPAADEEFGGKPSAAGGADPDELAKLLRRSRVFDPNWYCKTYSDVPETRGGAMRYYLQVGAKLGHWPSPLFDSDYYLSRNRDVATSGENPLAHFVRVGGMEGRDPHPLFAAGWYLRRYPDVARSGGDPLTHYNTVGAAGGYDPHPYFSTAWIRANTGNPRPRFNPLRAYCTSPWGNYVDPHPLFSAAFYRQQVSPNELNGTTPLAHFVTTGIFRDANPHPLLYGTSLAHYR